MATQLSGVTEIAPPTAIDPSTSFIVKDADDARYASVKASGHQVVGQLMQFRTAEGLEADGVGISHRRFEGQRSGPALIMGMGPSRKMLGARLNIPVFSINRAATETHTDIWCAHDIDAVLDFHTAVPIDVPLATYSCNWLKKGFDAVVDSGRPLIFWDIFPEPLRHGRRPLYWNVSTLGPVMDWVARMGHNPIYTLGTDLNSVGYGNKRYSDRAMEVEHEYVRLKMCFMFQDLELPKWNVNKAQFIDCSGGNAPWTHGDLSLLGKYVV